jgi:hypothetical protein
MRVSEQRSTSTVYDYDYSGIRVSQMVNGKEASSEFQHQTWKSIKS